MDITELSTCSSVQKHEKFWAQQVNVECSSTLSLREASWVKYMIHGMKYITARGRVLLRTQQSSSQSRNSSLTMTSDSSLPYSQEQVTEHC
jgi:hypothetical protein